MAKRISDLPPVIGAVQPSDVLPIDQGSPPVTRKTTAAQMFAGAFGLSAFPLPANKILKSDNSGNFGVATSISEDNSGNVTIRKATVDVSTLNVIGTDTGPSANTYVVSISQLSVALTAGLRLQFIPTHANTGASTLAVNALTAKNIVLPGGAALPANSLNLGVIADVLYDGTSFVLQSTGVPGAATTVSSIAALRALSKLLFTGAVVTGYTTAGDGGGGIYRYDPTDTTSSDNGGSIIVASDGARWKLLIQGFISVKQFGAVCNGVADDRTAVSAADTVAYAARVPLVFPGTTYIATSLTIQSRLMETSRQIFTSTSIVKFANATHVRPEWWGADLTGVADSEAAFSAAIVAATPANPASLGPEILVSSGVYTWVTSPNFGVPNLAVRALGTVLLKCTGTENALVFDAGTLTAQRNFNVSFRGQFFVEGNAAGKNGVFVRSIHHSKIEARVQGCGPTYAAFFIQFSVCNDYWFTASGNEKVIGSSTSTGGVTGIGFVSGCIPKYGIYCTTRNAFELVSDCNFHNPIIEGVSSDGIYLYGAIMNKFFGGTSESNVGRGVYCSPVENPVTYPPPRNKDFAATFNEFYGLDMETNTGTDVFDNGIGNVFNGCYSDSTYTVGSSAYRSTIYRGTYNNITDNGIASKFRDVNYANNGGVFTANGTLMSRIGVWNNTGLYYLEDINQNDVGPTTLNLATGAATTMFALPGSITSVSDSLYQIYGYLKDSADAPNYAAYMIVSVSLGTVRVISTNNSPKLALSMVGLNVQANQTSGATNLVTVKAVRL